MLVGRSFNGTDRDLAVWRVTADGSLDTTFNGTGFVVLKDTAGGPGDDSASHVMLDGDGKIIVTGSSSNGTDSDLVVWRINP